MDGLLRGDYQSRMNGHATARQNGWMSANDIRELENLDRIPAEEDGDLYLINGNMVAIIAKRMFSGEDAPLHPIGDQEVVNRKSNTIPLRSKNLTTLSAIYIMTEILLAKEEITPKTRRNEECSGQAFL